MSSPVTLREITRANLDAVLSLKVSPAQKHFVASNAESIAEAHYSPGAWFRAVYAEETPVGFVLLEDERQEPNAPENAGIYLWRFMIAADHQGKGYGKEALTLAIAQAREMGGARMNLSYVPGDGSPEPFYRAFGFEPTGEIEDGEIVMARTL